MAVRKGVLFTGYLAGISPPSLLQPGDNGTNSFGDLSFKYSSGSGTPFVANRIITGGTTGAKARVVRDEGSGRLICEMVSIGGLPGTFRPGEVITDNSDTPKSATLAEVAGVLSTNAVIDYPLDVTTPKNLLAQLYNPKLNAAVPSDLSQNVFWYGAATLGNTLTVASTTSINRWDVVVGATSGAKALVEAKSATQLVLTPYNATAWTAGENVNIVGGASGVTTVGSGSPYTTKTAGEWGPFATLPNLGGGGSQWQVRPNGANTTPVANPRPLLGLESIAINRAYTQWGSDLRVLRVDAAADLAISAGIITNVLVLSSWTSGSGTFVAGETVTSSARAGWSAVVRSFDSNASSARYKWLYLTDITIGAGGALINGDPIVGGTSGATATVPGSSGEAVYGYQKGGRAFKRITDQLTAALAKAGGDTLDFQWVVVSPPIDDFAMPASSFDAAIVQRNYGQFVADLRTALSSTGAKVSLLLPDLRNLATTFPGAASVLREGILRLCRDDASVVYFYADGFEVSAGTLGGTTSPDSLTYEVAAYPQLGERAWNSYLGAIAPVVPSSYTGAPVVILTGNSILASNSYSYLVANQDPEYTKLPAGNPLVAGVPVSTLDSRIGQWNSLTKAWELLDVSSNAAGWGNTVPGQFGMSVSLLKHLADRYGTIYCIYLPMGGSTMEPSAGSPGAWDPDGFTSTVASASMTITASNKRITAAAGTFTGWLVNQYVQIAGSSAYILLGGNNSFPVRPFLISAVAGDGSYIEVNPGTGISMVDEGPKTFTITLGPVNLKTEAEREVREAITALTLSGKIPRVVLTGSQHGENDTSRTTNFYAKYSGHIDWLRSISGFRVGQEDVAPHFVVRISPYNPTGTDVQLASIQASQDQLATDKDRVFIVGKAGFHRKSDHKAEFTLTGAATWPRTSRTHYGIHLTPECVMRIGQMVDVELTVQAFPEIPVNPSPVEILGGGDSESTGGGDSESVDGSAAAATFVVEDGTIVAGANSYSTVEFADSYSSDYGAPTAWTSSTTAQKEEALRLGTRDIDALFEERFIGSRADEDQSLAWPRIYAYDRDGFAIASDVVPTVIKNITVLAAIARRRGDVVVPEVTSSGDIASESVGVGEITKSVTYLGGKPQSAVLSMVERILRQRGLIDGGGGWGYASR